jgi:hypothetical protein
MDFNQIYRVNKPFPWPAEKSPGGLPKAPINVFIISPYINGKLDIRWDNPALLPENGQFSLLGVNIYRSFESESGPYTLINTSPVGAGVYRDQTTVARVEDEVVTNLNPGTNPQGEWRFRTKFNPCVEKHVLDGLGTVTEGRLATSRDIVVKVDNGDGKGLLEVPIYDIKALTGEIILISQKILDPAIDRFIEPRLPINKPGSVTVSYYINTNRIRVNLHNRIFYKLTTVGLDANGNQLESDIQYSKATSIYEQEKTDWVWKESIRRNRWILEQGGERVKVFIRKWNGIICDTFDDVHQSSLNDCPICYGTNFVGGYEGPFDIIIAPPDTAKNVELTEIGLRVNYTFDTWTGPSPLLSKRDIIVRPSGERLTVGAVNYVGSRGAIYQQMFTAQQLDSSDIIYKVPVWGAKDAPAQPFDTRSDRTAPADPTIPANKATPDRNYPRDEGRTVTFEDIMW